MRPKWQLIGGANNNTADAISCATPPSPQSTPHESSSIHSLQDHQPTNNSTTSSLLHCQYEALRTHQAVGKELKLLVTKQHGSQPTEEFVLINDFICVMNEHIRIYVPHALCNTMLHDIHDATHPGLCTTLREASRLYYWPHMRRDVSNWTKACQYCQAAKVTKHDTTAPIVIAPSCGKFHDIHLDIVGPLNEIKRMCYILTAVGCFSRWTMAEPMPNQLASTVADTFIKGWIQHHGIPHTITTDRGANFESSLFKSLLQRFSSQHIHSTAYHPQQNRMVERWHRRLKDALWVSADDFSWVVRVPLIMLNLHIAQSDDGQPSPVEIVYGSSLTLPADLITPSSEKIEHNVLD